MLRFQCRPSFIKVGLASCALAYFIVLILAVLLLLPTLTEGPDNVHYLHRTECQVNLIEYISNYLPRDNSEDVFAVIYQPALEESIIVRLNISAPDFNRTCEYFLPDGYDTQKDAFIEISKTFVLDTKYKCVIDTINNVCYPDQNERATFVIWVSVFGGLFLLFLGLYFCIDPESNKEKVGKESDVEKAKK